LTSREIAINMVKDQIEAEDILEWLKAEINATWERRREITPSFEVAVPPRVLDVLKLCREPTAAPVASRPAWFLPYRYARGLKASLPVRAWSRKIKADGVIISVNTIWWIKTNYLSGGAS
jgi:hypothetical protein